MKKWEKYYISITGVIFIITCIISIIFLRNVSHLSEVTVVIIKMILCLILLLIEVAMVVYFSILGIITMKRGMHNIKKCDDELFTKIDQYKKCWGEDNNYYIKQIGLYDYSLSYVVENIDYFRNRDGIDYKIMSDAYFNVFPNGKQGVSMSIEEYAEAYVTYTPEELQISSKNLKISNDKTLIKK